MSRTLRSRKSRPNYALLDSGGASAAPGPSRAPHDDAGSDFALDGDADAFGSDSEKASSDDHEGGEPLLDRSRSPKLAMKGKGKKTKAKGKTATPAPENYDAISQNPLNHEPGVHRQMYQLPQPSANHRHKAIPIFRTHVAVERLVRTPALFEANETTRTNNFTSSERITERLNKAIGYNVGPGPLWSLYEDRGWFKESQIDGDAAGEAELRPRVYGGQSVYSEWTSMDSQDAMSHILTESAFACDLGPFCQQTSVSMQPLSSVRMSTLSPDSQAHVIYAGGPVHTLDWCPIFIKDRPHCSHRHFLAVAPLPSKDHSSCVGVKVQRPAPACIQVWSLGPSAEPKSSPDSGTMQCELVLCTDCGPALDLKWCPLPSHDSLAEAASNSPRRLGLLAGTFEDGSLSIFSVPYPPDLQKDGITNTMPTYVRLGEPAIKIELEDAACWCLDWANSEVLAVGCTNGVVAVYDVGKALQRGKSVTDLLPTHYMHVHQSGVRAVSWIRAPLASGDGKPDLKANPTVIASGGQDGLECFTDIRDPSSHTMNRTRDVVPSIPYSPYAGGPITIDHENIMKAYSVSPSMLGRGHMLLEPTGPVWSASASDYHAQLAIGSADGTCMTANMLRSARRGSSVPFLQHKIFQLDYNRTTDAFRMLDHFLPQEMPDHSPNRLKKQSSQGLSVATGAWPACIGVTRVAWHNGGGLGGAGLLASATASGLCRVDWLQGRWMKDWVIYGGVEGIRLENGTSAMDIDDEDES